MVAEWAFVLQGAGVREGGSPAPVLLPPSFPGGYAQTRG